MNWNLFSFVSAFGYFAAISFYAFPKAVYRQVTRMDYLGMWYFNWYDRAVILSWLVTLAWCIRWWIGG